MAYYYNGTTSKKVLSVVEVKEVEVDYYVGCATYDTSKQDSFIVPNYISVNGANFPILDNTKTSVFEIGGNSIAFNQIMAIYPVGYSGWNVNQNYGTLSLNNNVYTYELTNLSSESQSINNTYLHENNLIISNHKYLYRFKVKSEINTSTNLLFNGSYAGVLSLTANIESIYSAILTGGSNNRFYQYFSASNFEVGDKITFRDFELFDLTLMFGAGNEPTSVAEFEALFPNDYYDYNQGEIKNSVVKGIRSWNTNEEVIGVITISRKELCGINDIHDTLTFEEQANGTYNAILTRKIGVVDLGTLTYSYYTSGANPLFYVNLSSTLKGAPNNNVAFNGLCKLYVADTNQKVFYTSGTDKSMCAFTNGILYIADSSYTSATDFKTAMSGVNLYYELATPTTETIATGLTFDQVSTLFEKGGRIQVLNPNKDYIQCNLSMAFAIRRFRSEEQ